MYQPAYYQRPSRGLSPAGPSPFAPSLGRGPGGGAPWTSAAPLYDPSPTIGSYRSPDRGLGIDASLPGRNPVPEFGAIPGALHRDSEYLDRYSDRFSERWRRREQFPGGVGADPLRYPDLPADPYADPLIAQPQRSSDFRPGSLRGWEDGSGISDEFGAARWDSKPPGEKVYGLRPPAGLHVPSFPEPRLGRWRQPQQDLLDDRFGSYMQHEPQRPYCPPSMPEVRKDLPPPSRVATEARKDMPWSFEAGLRTAPEVEKGWPTSPEARKGLAPEGKIPFPFEGGPEAGRPFVSPVEGPAVVPGDGFVKGYRQEDADKGASHPPTGAFALLKDCEAQLQSASAELGATEDALRRLEVSPGQAWNDLAQLEARLDQLQCKGIDFVSITGLTAEDEDVARTKRRQLTKAVAQLQDQVEAAFDRLKSSRAST